MFASSKVYLLLKLLNEKLNGNIKDHNVLESIIFVRMDLVCYQYGVYNHRHNILTTLQGFSPVSIHNTWNSTWYLV